MPIAAAIGPIVGGVMGMIGSHKAGGAISGANTAAATGVQDATKAGQANIQNAITSGQGGVNQSLQDAIARMTQSGTDATGTVNNATTNANSSLQALLDQSKGNLDPYLKTGQQGATDLGKYTAGGGPQFKFNYDDYKNSDAYKFQLDQGTQAINNSMSSRGLANSGAALKDLTNYGQGLASTYYDNAFQRAQSQFQTNQNSSLQNLMAATNVGQTATNQFQGAQAMFGAPQATNTLNAGYFGGNTNLSIAQMLSQMGNQSAQFNSQTGMQGNEFGANLGLQGANDAGKFMVGAGQGQAAGTMGMFNNLGGALSGIGGLFKPQPGPAGLGGLDRNIYTGPPSGGGGGGGWD